jgi:hypothetical protein
MPTTRTNHNDTMTTYDKLTSKIKAEIAEREQQLEFLESIKEQLQSVSCNAVFYGDGIDFDNMTHSETIGVIKAFGGDWEKKPNANGTSIDYERDWEGRTLRVWAGQPPPNCKLVDVIETVPAQPEHTVTRKRLVCV